MSKRRNLKKKSRNVIEPMLENSKKGN